MPSTDTVSYQDGTDSQHYLSSSLSSLSRSKTTSSFIVRTYKQATQLYLTRRFKEALDTLEPIITPQPASENGHSNGHHSNGHSSDLAHSAAGPAPVAQASRSTRTKVWVFYLSLLNSIIALGSEEGRVIFGGAKWKEITAKVQSGSVWDEVVQRGYGGQDGDVDADVVVNLATLLSGHMQDQTFNQQRLETYLATSDAGPGGHLSWSQDGMSTPMSNSSSSPKTLATRLKILEIYTLHVLPANGEWEYSRSFIDMSDMLDEERKEAFLNALQNLKAEKDGLTERQRELEEQREQEMEQQRREEEEERRRAVAEEEARKQEEQRRHAEAEKQKATRTVNGSASSQKPVAKPLPTPAPSAPSSRPSSKAQRKQPTPPSPPPTFYRRASSLLLNFQHLVVKAGQSMNTMAILRLLMFIAAFLLLIARRDLRMRIRRGMEDGWVKIKQTVGMGVK